MSSITYDPPEDGLWGALEASGNMSGLIGQAAYNEVDMVLSGVMTTRDRSTNVFSSSGLGRVRYQNLDLS